MSHKMLIRSALPILGAVALVLAGVAPALADAANPLPGTNGTTTLNPDGSITVTVQGTWDWQSRNGTVALPCNKDRFGVGWAVAWGDPNAPGNKVSKGSVTLFVGTPTDNTVHFDAAQPCGTLGADGHPTGNWGTESHTYAKGTQLPAQVCVNMYDLHDDQASKPGDYVAGGSGHNGDNSVESNAFVADGSFCYGPPADGGTPVPVGAVGALGLAVLLGLTLLVVGRRHAAGSTSAP